MQTDIEKIMGASNISGSPDKSNRAGAKSPSNNRKN